MIRAAAGVVVKRSAMVRIFFNVIAVLIVVTPVGSTPSPDQVYRKFDELADMTWKEARARLDNYVIAMRNEPEANAIIIVHQKQSSPKIVSANCARCIYDYLVKKQHIPSDRVVFLEGTVANTVTIELWLGRRKTFPDPKVRPLTMGKSAKGSHACSSSKPIAHHTQFVGLATI